MSDRLRDLQRQRALAQEQAAALEREIAREMNPAGAPAAAPSPPAPVAAKPGNDAHAAELIERYAPKEKPLHDQVKQGCLIYLAIAFGCVGLGILALYIYHHLK